MKFCPMLVNDTARTLIKMLEKGLRGLYHLVGPQAMSKYQFGVEIARKFALKESEISPKSILSYSLTAGAPTTYPYLPTSYPQLWDESLPEFSTGLNEFYTQYEQGYPQKIRSYAQV